MLRFFVQEGTLGCETRGDANDDGSLDLGLQPVISLNTRPPVSVSLRSRPPWR